MEEISLARRGVSGVVRRGDPTGGQTRWMAGTGFVAALRGVRIESPVSVPKGRFRST